jgi:NADP-dependent 3-hydroxy acid dehydrogenase YdfG
MPAPTPTTLLEGSVAVVLGATGRIGGGAVFQLLHNGATFVAVGRSTEKLAAIEAKVNAPRHRHHAVQGPAYPACAGCQR